MVSAQKVIVEDPNTLGHGPIEASNLFDQWHIHEKPPAALNHLLLIL